MKIYNYDGELLFDGPKEDLPGAFLRNADLRNANFWGANLQGADLREADFRRANLRSANLRGAYLQGADFRNANLQDARLEGADLSGANLLGTKLDNATIKNAKGIDEALAKTQATGTREAWEELASTKVPTPKEWLPEKEVELEGASKRFALVEFFEGEQLKLPLGDFDPDDPQIKRFKLLDINPKKRKKK